MSHKPADAVLSPDEVADAQARFEAELAADHAARKERVQRRQARRQAHSSSRSEAARNTALNAIKAQVQAEFYRSHGYKKYTDATGREHWLTPEEYDYRMQRRRKRRHRVMEPVVSGRLRSALFMVGLASVAIALGFMLAR